MKPLISSVKIDIQGNHARLGVYNRGARAGILTVNKDDAFPIATRLVVDRFAEVRFDDWKWTPYENYDAWFGIRVGDNDYWELRVYPNSYNIVWEAWNYQESDPVETANGTESSFNEAFLCAMDYVKQVEG